MEEITPETDEHYRFLRLYSIDLDTAKHSCNLIKTQDSLDVRFPLLRDLVVTYSRPFSSNRGSVSRTHKLDVAVIPAEMRPLHDELLSLRDQAFAHTDREFHGPEIGRYPKSEGAAYFMSFRRPAYEGLNARLDEILGLVVSVEASVNEEIRQMELMFDELFKQGKLSVRPLDVPNNV